jgi:hypothetical protein
MTSFIVKQLKVTLLLVSLVSCAQLKNQTSVAPNLLTMSDDQFWVNLVNQSIDKKESILTVLSLQTPILFHQIMVDSEDQNLLNFWGQSLNFDSGAKKQILGDQIISNLFIPFHLKTNGQIVHAGVTHTYGYLLSTLVTPYGYKRKRWIDHSLNEAFSLTDLSLSPEATEGSLLSNTSFFAGHIAFENQKNLDKLNTLKNVSNEIRHFNYSKLEIDTLKEDIIEHNILAATLKTSLVKFPFKKLKEENDYLLVYSILLPKNHQEILITAFPIKLDAYNKITNPELLGDGQSISIRYNAYLEDFMDKKLTGKRVLKHM